MQQSRWANLDGDWGTLMSDWQVKGWAALQAGMELCTPIFCGSQLHLPPAQPPPSLPPGLSLTQRAAGHRVSWVPRLPTRHTSSGGVPCHSESSAAGARGDACVLHGPPGRVTAPLLCCCSATTGPTPRQPLCAKSLHPSAECCLILKLICTLTRFFYSAWWKIFCLMFSQTAS